MTCGKRIIRQNTFETNSSSVHSLVFSNEGREPSQFVLEDGYIWVSLGDFGTDLCIYDTQYDKLSYLMTCLYYIGGYSIEGIYNSFEFIAIEAAICNYTGAKGIKINPYSNGYIDHQSAPYGSIEIINVWNDDEVINFVFNKHISLKTDCD